MFTDRWYIKITLFGWFDSCIVHVFGTKSNFFSFFSCDCLYSIYLFFLSHSFAWHRFQCSSIGIWSVWMGETCWDLCVNFPKKMRGWGSKSNEEKCVAKIKTKSCVGTEGLALQWVPGCSFCSQSVNRNELLLEKFFSTSVHHIWPLPSSWLQQDFLHFCFG